MFCYASSKWFAKALLLVTSAIAAPDASCKSKKEGKAPGTCRNFEQQVYDALKEGF